LKLKDQKETQHIRSAARSKKKKLRMCGVGVQKKLKHRKNRKSETLRPSTSSVESKIKKMNKKK